MKEKCKGLSTDGSLHFVEVEPFWNVFASCQMISRQSRVVEENGWAMGSFCSKRSNTLGLSRKHYGVPKVTNHGEDIFKSLDILKSKNRVQRNRESRNLECRKQYVKSL